MARGGLPPGVAAGVLDGGVGRGDVVAGDGLVVEPGDDGPDELVLDGPDGEEGAGTPVTALVLLEP